MDKLFTGGIEEMKEKLSGIEPEMREDCYPDKAPKMCSDLLMNAEKYIVKVASHMIRCYQENQHTVLNLILELFRVAATGEYAYLQDDEEIGVEDDVFENMKGDNGYAQILYAIRLLRYYYLVYEKRNHPNSEWDKINQIYKKYIEMKTLAVYSRRMKKKVPHDIPEDEFIPSLRKHLDQYMVGQDVLKKKLCTVLYQWIYHNQRTVMLIIGPSGSGKNHVIETIRSFPGLGRTLTSFDCSGLTPAGFNGGEVKHIFKKLRQEVSEKKKSESQHSTSGIFSYFQEGSASNPGSDLAGSIIYLDEIDKIINFNHDSHDENVNAMVQQSLLSSLAGTEVIEGVDTSKILFILGGAFTKIEEIEKEKKRCAIGFNTQIIEVEDFSISLRDQIMAIGGETEFVGRIQEIAKIEKLSRDDLKAILMDEKIGEFSKKQRVFKNSGMQLLIDDDAVETIIDLIENDPAGARSVKNIINQFADSQYFYDMKVGRYDTMRIHKGMLRGEPPIFSRGGVSDEKVVCYA